MHSSNFPAKGFGTRGGIIFEPIVVVFTFGILLFAFFAFTEKQASFSQKIGEKQYALINAYHEGEIMLLYLDRSAEIAAEDASYQTGKKGGIPAACPQFFGYSVWDIQSSMPSCSPSKESSQKTYGSLTLDSLHRLSSQYSPSSSPKIPLSLFNEAVIDGQNIRIIAKAPLSLFTLDNSQVQDESLIEDRQEAEEEAFSLPSQSGSAAVSLPNPDLIKVPASCKGSCVLRKDAFEAFVRAQAIAKERNVELEIYSSYRSLEYQKALWDGKTSEKYAQVYPDPAIRSKYVCNPYLQGAEERCPHLTGGAVDIKFAGKTKSQMSRQDWLLLEDIMYKAGWVRYSVESWHFEYQTTRWQLAKAEERRTGQEVRAFA